MRRMLWAGLLALPLLLAAAEPAKAQTCASCANRGLVHPLGWYNEPFHGPFGCNGFCFKFFGTWLQDGPLVNYGPYEGYYPFEPYGPWTSDLRYTGPTSRNPYTGGGGLFHRQAFGDYALSTFRNVFRRTHPCSGGCGG